MLENIKYATISQIYIKDLLFYNIKEEEKLKDFCVVNGITYLPAKSRDHCYRLNGDSFEISELEDALICNPYDRLFDQSTIAKFEKGNHDEVMFVMEKGKIKGVVHIVDYNASFINFEFYKAIYHFEKMMRDLLVSKNENNQSLMDWMKEKSKQSEHWHQRYNQCSPLNEEKRKRLEKKRKECPQFQTFYLSDLISFASSKGYVSDSFKKSLNAISEVRNWVAHNKDLAFRVEESMHPLFHMDELKKFVNSANQFFDCYEELELNKND